MQKLWILFLLVSTVLSAQTEKEKKTKAKAEEKLKTENLRGRAPLNTKDLRKIQTKLQDNQNLVVDFEQIMVKKLRGNTIRNPGKAFFQKPHSFRWAFGKNRGEEWIFDGKDLIHYFPKEKASYAHRYKNQATKVKELKEIVDMVLNFDRLLSRYDIGTSYQEGDSAFLSLRPKEKGDITGVDLLLDLKQNFIKVVSLDLIDGNKSTFNFSNPQRNPLKPQDFEVPPNVKITDAI